MMKLRLNQRGDTLVEVTMALAILALVLTGAFVAANRSYLLGQQAKERSQIVDVAQQQAEALESLRDSRTWTEFVNGTSAGVNGIRVRGAGSGQFYMAQQTVGGVTQWAPRAGKGTDGGILGNQAAVWITVYNDPGATATPASFRFIVHYNLPARGGGPAMDGTLWLILANTDLLR
jgi:prepilin-type N-terminal cleavage/methylation domain-containing protein